MRSWLKLLVVVLLTLVVSRPAFADERAIDDDEILGVKPDDTTFRITSMTSRITAYDQQGRGYQSKAGGYRQPGSERLTVFQPQLEILAKHGDRLTHRIWIPVDVVTSASADAIDRYSRPDLISSASRSNEAGTVDWTMTYKATPEVDISLRNGIHLEEEFRSWHSGLTVSRGFADQQTVLSAGVLTVLDWFDNFDIFGGRHGRTRRATHTGSIGVTQILTPTTVAEASYGLTVQTGELGNTWNVVPLENGLVSRELMPQDRIRHALVGRLAQALPWNGVLKGYYRFYADSWSIGAHSIEGTLLQRLTSLLYVSAGYRHHVQTPADFFTTSAIIGAPLRTADSDLARFHSSSITTRISLDVPLTPPGPRALHVDVAYERYWRTNDLQMNVMTCSTGFSF